MTRFDKSKNLFGDSLYQIRARKALPILVRQAKAYSSITYTDISQELGMSNPRNMDWVLGSIGNTLLELSEKWKEEIPLINCLVVGKNSFLPGRGWGTFYSDEDKYTALSRKEKEQLIAKRSMDVFAYKKWDEVLHALGLEPAPSYSFGDLKRKVEQHREGVGESPSHKAYKEYVSQHPELLGLPRSASPGDLEYVLPSADRVDIRFTHDDDWIMVEVKSRISSEDDLYRGIYQCIKYKAVTEAFQTEKGLPQSCRVVLVIEGLLSERLFSLKNQLNVEVIQNVAMK